MSKIDFYTICGKSHVCWCKTIMHVVAIWAFWVVAEYFMLGLLAQKQSPPLSLYSMKIWSTWLLSFVASLKQISPIISSTTSPFINKTSFQVASVTEKNDKMIKNTVMPCKHGSNKQASYK